MAAQIHLFPCLQDNYGVLLHDPESSATASIDAPEAGAVEAALRSTGWRLTDILVTHHHNDHTAGIPALKQQYRCRVVAPRSERVADADVLVGEGETVHVGGLTARVLDTPGHTAGHISYWFPDETIAFVGDTLFSIGCGRILEGTPEMMWTSLLKLRDLPDATRIYCGHEYTAANIAFARTIEPRNPDLLKRAEEVSTLRAQGKPTIPVTIGAEKMANPFLRADVAEVAAAAGASGAAAAQVFAKIRSAKDVFRG